MAAGVRYNRITQADLEDNDRLVILLDQLVKRGRWKLTGELDVLNFFALAEKALQDDDTNNPGGLFRYLIDNKKVSMISGRNEDRACARIDAAARRLIYLQVVDPAQVDSTGRSQTKRPQCETDVLGYLPQGFTSGIFPRKKPDGNMESWSVRNAGGSVITVQRTRTRLPGFPPPEIPYGGMPRLIFAYLVGEAVRRNQVVNLGRTKNRFLNRLGYSENAKNRTAVSEQLAQLSVCDITIQTTGRKRGEVELNLEQFNLSRSVQLTRPTHVFDRFTTTRRLFDPDRTHNREWKTVFWFSKDFMRYARKKPMPVRLDHLKALSKSPRRMDLYTWLSNRVYYVRKNPVRVPLLSLHEQFAPEIDPGHHRLFKSRLKRDLAAIQDVYQSFNIEVSSSNLTVYASIPPVDPHR